MFLKGSYLTIYANDTRGDLSEDSVSFTVDISGISLTIHSQQEQKHLGQEFLFPLQL